MKEFVEDLWSDITVLFSVGRERIERLWIYGKYIWNIGEWDHSWHTGLWKLGLERLYEIQDDHPYTTFKHRDKRKMRTAINLLDRISKDYTFDNGGHMDYFWKKWGKPYFKCIPHIVDKNNEKLNPKQLAQKNKERIRVWENEKYRTTQDLELLGKILKTDLNKWST